MTRETEVKALLEANAELTALLTGGIYTEQEVGVEGIRRGENSPTTDAYDEDGTLLPCLLIREGGQQPYAGIRSIHDKFSAMAQVVYLYFYEFRGHDVIVPAARLVYTILEGERLGRSYPIWMSFESQPVPDDGPMMNSTLLRQDWSVVSTRQG